MGEPLFNDLRRYLRAAPFPHLTTVSMGACALLALLEALYLAGEGRWWSALAAFMLSAPLFWGMVLCQADAWSRFREFKRVRAILSRYGFRTRILQPVSTSRCQRDAALLAAAETGFQTQARDYFKNLGYRWYHIIPDQILANPLNFFQPDFFKSTFIPGKKEERS